MARKKKGVEAPAGGGWINTFADLMNLLLCFFVLLFSMSTVDADKYEQLVTSMSDSISIFDGGGEAIGDGAFVTTGTDQVVAISQYFNEFEKSGEDENSDAHKDDSTEPSQQDDSKQNPEATQRPNANSDGDSTDETDKMVADAIEKMNQAAAKERKNKAEEIYNDIKEQANKGNIEDDLTVNMDENYTYVQISLSGAILFDSGTAEIKKSARSLISKVGDMLKLYENHMIKIEGHTDNVPISGGQFKNNRWLSMARAMTVFEYLEQNKGLKAKNMETTGRGASDPVGDNKTEKGRAQNRRVEIKIYTDN